MDQTVCVEKMSLFLYMVLGTHLIKWQGLMLWVFFAYLIVNIKVFDFDLRGMCIEYNDNHIKVFHEHL